MSIPVEKDVFEFSSVMFDGPEKPRVDREKGIIHNVKILGRFSKNGGEYLPSTVKSAVSMYEGAKSNADHPDRDRPGADRLVSSRLGKFVNVRESGGELYGDYHLLKSHPMANTVMEAAENPTLSDCFGFSHNARVLEINNGGKLQYTKITRVRSVDLVADPGTTKSLFESYKEQPIMEPIDKYLADSKAVLESELTAEEKSSKLKTLTNNFLGVKEVAVTESRKEDLEELAKVKSELDKTSRKLKAREVLESANIPADSAKVTALAALDNEEDRQALLKTWPTAQTKSEGAKPRSVPANVLESEKEKLESEKSQEELAKKAEKWTGNHVCHALMGF